MLPAEASPPTKKRKLNKIGSSSCNKKELMKSFRKQGDNRKKVLEGVRDRLQNVTVAFYSASELALLGKKNKKNKKGRSDFKHGDKGMPQDCYSFIKKGKEGVSEAPYVSHQGHLKHRQTYSSYRCSSLPKAQNLSDLLPHSQFYSVRKRTPFSCKVDHFRSDANIYLPNGHDSKPNFGAHSNRDTYLAVPISLGAAQRGGFSLFSQISEKNTAESEIFPLFGAERKHSEKRTHNFDFKGSLLDEGAVQIRGKFTRAYVRKKYRVPFFKDEGPDFYALHLLADAAMSFRSDPKFEIQVQKQNEASVHGCNEHAPLSTSNNSHTLNVYTERNGGLASTSIAASVHRKALQSDKVFPTDQVFPAVNLLTCTSINEDFNQSIKKKISRDNINNGPHMDELHLTKDVATNADQNVEDAEIGLIDCDTSMCIQLPTLEDVEINESNDKDTVKLFSAASEKDVFLPEHRERNHETLVGKNDIDVKSDSNCFMGQHSVFVSKDSIFHDKVSSFLCELEPCNTCYGNSQPTLRCIETQQMSAGCPSSSNTVSFFNGSLENSQNTRVCPISFITSNLASPNLGYHAKSILHSSRQKAFGMVDVAIKVMSSMKAGEDAHAMIGRALDSAEIQQFGIPSKILRTQHCFNPQNGSQENCHRDFSCSPAELAATVHLINSAVPTLTQNDSQVPPKLISACVAALLMIQASSDSRLPPAEIMEILEHAARDLRPHYSQNLHIYREIEDLMSIIKTQILTLVRTPTSNLHL